MTDIGLFGGRGTSEESYLQNARCQYTVLDEVDVAITSEYRRFKFLIFPSRLATFAETCVDSINSNPTFQACMERFLERGGRILLCPPLMLPSDYEYHRDYEKDGSVVNWLPIGNLKWHSNSQRSKKKVSLQVDQSDHPICVELTGQEQFEIYGHFSFEEVSDAQVIVSTSQGIPVITQIPVNSGFVLINVIDWPFLHPRLSSNDAIVISLFNSILSWGQKVASIAVTFNSLVTLVKMRVGNHEAHLMERADQSILMCRYSEACDYAFKAFERIMRNKAGRAVNLNQAINHLFPGTSAENHFCHGLRISRNASAHGTRLPEEITVEETESLFSLIKFILYNLL